MKRLFEVNGQFFSNKTDAKLARGPRNAGGRYTYPVRKGPDHDGNHGKRVPASRHRAPQHWHEHKVEPQRFR
jgi:hypothetical protein